MINIKLLKGTVASVFALIFAAASSTAALAGPDSLPCSYTAGSYLIAINTETRSATGTKGAEYDKLIESRIWFESGSSSELPEVSVTTGGDSGTSSNELFLDVPFDIDEETGATITSPVSDDITEELKKLRKNNRAAKKNAKKLMMAKQGGLSALGAAPDESGSDEVIMEDFIYEYGSNGIKDPTYKTIKLIYEGEYCTVWGEVNENCEELTISESNAKEIADKFDSEWDNFISYFGDYKEFDYSQFGAYNAKGDTDGDGKLAIVCYDIGNDFLNNMGEDGLSAIPDSYTGGFFRGADIMVGKEEGAAQDIYINSMDCIHLDTFPTMAFYDETNYTSGVDDLFENLSAGYSTLFHELQHLTESAMTNTNPLPTFLNEAFSMAAEHLICGSDATYRRVRYFNNNYTYGTPLTWWCYNNHPYHVLDNYSSSYLFGQYLRTRYWALGVSASSDSEDENKGSDVYAEVLSKYYDYLQSAEEDDIMEDYYDDALEDVFGVPVSELIHDFWYAVVLLEDIGNYGFAGEDWANNISVRFEKELPSGRTEIYNSGMKLYELTEDATLDGIEDATMDILSPGDDEADIGLKIDLKIRNSENEWQTYKSDIQVEYGGEATIPDDQDPVDFGFDASSIFTGWFEDKSMTSPFDLSRQITRDMTLYGGWIDPADAKEVTITFHANDSEATGTMEPMTVYKGQSVMLDTCGFELDGMQFIAWSTSPDYEEYDDYYMDEEYIFAEKDIDLYALWLEEADYFVFLDPNGGSPEYYAAAFDGEILDPPDDGPTRAGYKFAGWYEDEECTIEFDFSTPIHSYMILYAKWIKESDESKNSDSKGSDSKGSSGRSHAGVPRVSTTIRHYASDYAAAVSGDWQFGGNGKWSLLINGVPARSMWVNAINPYAGYSQPRSSWFYFDERGELVTGWRKIADAAGNEYWYYLNPDSDGCLGACYLNGITPDGYRVDTLGRWIP